MVENTTFSHCYPLKSQFVDFTLDWQPLSSHIEYTTTVHTYPQNSLSQHLTPPPPPPPPPPPKTDSPGGKDPPMDGFWQQQVSRSVPKNFESPKMPPPPPVLIFQNIWTPRNLFFRTVLKYMDPQGTNNFWNFHRDFLCTASILFTQPLYM